MKSMLIILTPILYFTALAQQGEPKNRNKKFADTLFKDTMYKKGMDDSKEIKHDSSRAKTKSRPPRKK